jgi:menaquinone-dependent protoporphyrinogen oxidase
MWQSTTRAMVRLPDRHKVCPKGAFEMRVLVTAATRHDATREIAEAIAAGLVARGIEAESRPIDEVTDLAGYDAVVLGSAVYMGRWLKPARQFAEHHGTSLAAVPVWLFSSGPLGPPGNLVPTGEPADVTELVKLTGTLGHRVFAGRFERERLGFAERAVGKAVHAPEGDCRDWSAIDSFAGEIAAQLAAAHLSESGVPQESREPAIPSFARAAAL